MKKKLLFLFLFLHITTLHCFAFDGWFSASYQKMQTDGPSTFAAAFIAFVLFAIVACPTLWLFEFFDRRYWVNCILMCGSLTQNEKLKVLRKNYKAKSFRLFSEPEIPFEIEPEIAKRYFYTRV